MQLTSKYNKEICFLCVIDICSKYTWIVPSENEQGITIANALEKNFERVSAKAASFTIDQENHGCKIMMCKCIQLMMKETVIAERFIRNLKNKIHKYITSLSKMCILID